MTLDTHDRLLRAIHRSARLLDDQDHEAFLDLFTSDAQYSITSKAPELPEKMIWMRQSRDDLAERLKAMTSHEWEIASVEQTRIVSVDSISVTENTALTSSSFSLFHTDSSGRSELYVVGRYEDTWQVNGSSCLLERREVALRTRQLKLLSPLPI